MKGETGCPAGAGESVAPASRVQPRSIRLVSPVRLTRGLPGMAAAQAQRYAS